MIFVLKILKFNAVSKKRFKENLHEDYCKALHVTVIDHLNTLIVSMKEFADNKSSFHWLLLFGSQTSIRKVFPWTISEFDPLENSSAQYWTVKRYLPQCSTVLTASRSIYAAASLFIFTADSQGCRKGLFVKFSSRLEVLRQLTE